MNAIRQPHMILTKLPNILHIFLYANYQQLASLMLVMYIYSTVVYQLEHEPLLYF